MPGATVKNAGQRYNQLMDKVNYLGKFQTLMRNRRVIEMGFQDM